MYDVLLRRRLGKLAYFLEHKLANEVKRNTFVDPAAIKAQRYFGGLLRGLRGESFLLKKSMQ
jgi:hypothetical protein